MDSLSECKLAQKFFLKRMKILHNMSKKTKIPKEKRRLNSLYNHAEKDWKKYTRLINKMNKQIHLEKLKNS